MDTTLLSAAVLGLIEGLTEFLPVSSTGHLILFSDLLGFQGPPGHVFEIVIQLAAILAVVVLFRHKIINVIMGLPSDRTSQHFAATVLVAFLPAMVLGALFHDFIKDVLFNPYVVCTALIVGGVLLLLLEKLLTRPTIHNVDDISLKSGFKIGLVQCISMIPGVSRSASTIMGGLLLRLDKRTAAEFSFFLAIPTMAGAVTYDLYKNWALLSADSWVVIAVGFIVAFVAAMGAVNAMLTLVTRYGFAPFAYYRIILGAVMLALV